MASPKSEWHQSYASSLQLMQVQLCHSRLPNLVSYEALQLKNTAWMLSMSLLDKNKLRKTLFRPELDQIINIKYCIRLLCRDLRVILGIRPYGKFPHGMSYSLPEVVQSNYLFGSKSIISVTQQLPKFLKILQLNTRSFRKTSLQFLLAIDQCLPHFWVDFIYLHFIIRSHIQTIHGESVFSPAQPERLVPIIL
jgi:hypothetical protein